MSLRKILLMGLLGLVLIGCSPKMVETPQPTLPPPDVHVTESQPIESSTSDEATMTPQKTVPGKVSGFGIELAQMDALPLAEAAGNHWVRYNGLKWSKVQPDNSEQWLWENIADLEQDLIAIKEAGMEVILVIRHTPIWAQKYEGLFCGPMSADHLADFADFMVGVVNRYSVEPYDVKYFEIWNEPDVFNRSTPEMPYGCWGEQTEYFGGEYYGEMLKTVYPAIKAANPEAQVVLGGLLLDCDPRQPGAEGYCANEERAVQPKFFEGVLKAGGGDFFDVISFHGYSYYHPDLYPIQSEIRLANWRAHGGSIEGKLHFLDELQATFGIDKPYILSEAALLNDKEVTPEFEQAKAAYIVWLYTRNMAKGILATTWYTFDFPGWRNSTMLNGEQNPLPAYLAYQKMITVLDGAAFIQELNVGEGVLGFSFRNDHEIWVLFSEDGMEKSIPEPEGLVRSYDLFGEPVAPQEGKILFAQPIYLEIQP